MDFVFAFRYVRWRDLPSIFPSYHPTRPRAAIVENPNSEMKRKSSCDSGEEQHAKKKARLEPLLEGCENGEG